MIRSLHRHILLPAFETAWHRRKTFRYLAELEKSQWLPREQIEAKQFTSLQNLIAHAFTHCPYYRDAWNSLVWPPDPQIARRFQPLASHVTTRAQITENRARMRSSVPMKLIAKSTGGSSGEPLRFDLNFDSNDRRNAAAHRGYAWAGAELGTKMLYIWGAPIQQSTRGKIKDALYQKLYRRKLINSFSLSDERVPEILAQFNRYRPDFVVAYTNPLYDFARVSFRSRNLHPLPCRRTASSSARKNSIPSSVN